MTTNRNFKRAVRERMAATGENYTRARNALLAERAQRDADPAATVPVSDPTQTRNTP